MADEAWNRLAELIRTRREDRRMSQQELASAAGTTDRFIRSVEKAERETFNRGTLRTIADVLGWTPDSIGRILEGGEPEVAQSGESKSLEEMFADLDERLKAVEKILQDAAMTPDEKVRFVEGVAEGQRILDERKRRFNDPD